MDGKIFEDLVSWITKSLHSGEVLRNQKLPDIHTGKKRQIDVLLKITDGVIQLTGIIEARDRSRPVGVDYIEQIHSKKDSVKADFAVIVSNKGYYKTAIEKAKQLGIRLFSLEEALQYNWSLTTSSLRVTEQIFKTENSEVLFLNKENGDVIIPSEAVLSEHSTNPNAFVLKSKDGEPLAHVPSLIRPFQRFLQPHMKIGKENGHEFMIFFDLISLPLLYIQNNNNEDVLVNHIRIKSFCWLEEKELNPAVSHYKDPLGKELTAEIVSLNLTSSKEKIDFIIKNPKDINNNRSIIIKSKKEDDIVPPKTETQFWFTVNKLYQKHQGKFYRIPLNSDSNSKTDNL